MPETKQLEQEQLIISTEWLKKIALKSVVTCLGIIHFRTQETVTKPNGSSHSLGGTSDEVLKERKHLLDIYSVNEHPHQVNEDFFPR